MHNVYILRSSKDGRFYIGSTEDVNKRLREHNKNQTKSTKYKGPWELVYQEEVETKYQALHREHYIKGLKGNRLFKELVNRSSPSSSLA